MDDIDVELFGDPNAVTHRDRGGNSQIQVYARIRPTIKKQQSQSISNSSNTLQHTSVDYTLDTTANTFSLRLPSSISKDYINNSKEIYDYKFNGILGEKSTQEDVFQSIGQPAI